MKERRKEGKKERRKEGKKERRKEGKKERRKEGKKERKKKERKKKEDKQFAWAAISVYHFRNVCPLRQRHFHAQKNRLINPRCPAGISRNATTAKICNALPESRHLDFRRQASSPGDFHRLPTSARTSDSLRDS